MSEGEQIVVVGSAEDLEPLYPPGASVVHGIPERVGDIVLVVLDAREHDVDTLAAARRHPMLAHAPALVVTATPSIGERVLPRIDADDVIASPNEDARRRIKLLADLGRARLAILGGQELAMERERFARLAAMGTMVTGFAHEIRNPMASLRSLAEAMNEELAERGVELPHVQRMLRVLERVETLIKRSLLFGRPSPPRRATHAPWALLSAAVSSLLPRCAELGGELRVEATAGLPDVFVDETQIVQILIILLNNALDATASTERVVLRASPGRATEGARQSDRPPAFVRLEVRDDGPGIRPEVLGRIFDPFYTTKSNGTGLGLSIAQQLATENGARIEVESTLGGPTTFTLLVPIAWESPAPSSR